MSQNTDVAEIVESILYASPGKEITIIVVGGGEEKETPDEELVMDEEDESIDFDMEYFREAYLAAMFGEPQMAAGGGGGGSGPAPSGGDYPMVLGQSRI